MLQISNTELRVGIMCENEIIRFGLKAAISNLGIVDVVREISQPSSVALAEEFETLDVVVISCDDWTHALRAVTVARKINVRSLAFVDDGSAKDLQKLVELRPDGFVLQKELTKERLEDALIRVSRREVPIPPEISTRLFDTASHTIEASRLGYIKLTAREQDALQLLADGLTNKEIAKCLAISIHGVKRLVGNILLKLNSPNRTQAVVLAMRHGLVER